MTTCVVCGPLDRHGGEHCVQCHRAEQSVRRPPSGGWAAKWPGTDLTDADIAREVGVSSAAVWCWRNGRNGPNPENARRLNEVLDRRTGVRLDSQA